MRVILLKLYLVVYERADLSVSNKHSRTNILACTIPRFNLSAELLDPLYVGRISRPISSITIKSCAYFDKLELLFEPEPEKLEVIGTLDGM